MIKTNVYFAVYCIPSLFLVFFFVTQVMKYCSF